MPTASKPTDKPHALALRRLVYASFVHHLILNEQQPDQLSSTHAEKENKTLSKDLPSKQSATRLHSIELRTIMSSNLDETYGVAIAEDISESLMMLLVLPPSKDFSEVPPEKKKAARMVCGILDVANTGSCAVS